MRNKNQQNNKSIDRTEIIEACESGSVKIADPDEAYLRLKGVRATMKFLNNNITQAGTQSMPDTLRGKYENLWKQFREIEKEEASIITFDGSIYF